MSTLLMLLNQNDIQQFQKHIWDFYKNQGRLFAWRNTGNPYYVVVSEIMLQQTQTYRVEPKFEQFITTFPNFEILAQASLRDVLSVWQGLGYNRRGMYLHKIAQEIVAQYNGLLPQSEAMLVTLPGIGKATASSICAFAFNMPTIFIETNIRTVFIHTFFNHVQEVSDQDLLPLIKATVDQKNPREWYYALMDYGVLLKKIYSNPSRKSAHYAKQSKFQGSNRQIRGKIIKLLTEHVRISKEQLLLMIKDERAENILLQLCQEGFIKEEDDYFFI